jgi:hypothetical protein
MHNKDPFKDFKPGNHHEGEKFTESHFPLWQQMFILFTEGLFIFLAKTVPDWRKYRENICVQPSAIIMSNLNNLITEKNVDVICLQGIRDNTLCNEIQKYLNQHYTFYNIERNERYYFDSCS